MSEVVGNPEEIEAFARELDNYCQSTMDHLLQIRGRLDAMESERSWADERYRQYREMFDTVSDRLRQSIDEIKDSHLQHLQSVAQRLRAYLEG